MITKFIEKGTRRAFVLSSAKIAGLASFGATLVGTVIAACGEPPSGYNRRSGSGYRTGNRGCWDTGSAYGNNRRDAGRWDNGLGYGNNRRDAGRWDNGLGYGNNRYDAGNGNNWPCP